MATCRHQLHISETRIPMRFVGFLGFITLSWFYIAAPIISPSVMPSVAITNQPIKSSINLSFSLSFILLLLFDYLPLTALLSAPSEALCNGVSWIFIVVTPNWCVFSVLVCLWFIYRHLLASKSAGLFVDGMR